jgi:uncharacterized protein (TIGR00369 family)
MIREANVEEGTQPTLATARGRLRGRRGEIPAWATAGLVEIGAAPLRTLQQMDVPAWMRDHTGGIAIGCLAILSDSALGYAVMSTVPEGRGMATSHMHIEVLRPLPADASVLYCAGEQRAINDRFGLGEGNITGADGIVLAQATIGAVLLDAPAHHERVGDPEPTPPSAPGSHALVEDSPVLEELRTEVVGADRTGVRLLMAAEARFANSSGGLHGGFGVLMGERTLDLALRVALDGERTMRPIELRAAFLRPIVADGTPIECNAAVMHLGRRLAATRGEVRDHRGRPAVLVDATYIAS